MNWLLIAAPAGAALAGILTLSTCHPDPRIQQAKSQAVTAVAQDHLNQAVTTVGQQDQAKTVKLLITTREAVRDVQIAPGASSPVPPDVLRSWSAGIDRLRAPDAAKPGSTGGDDPASDQAALQSPR